MHITKDDLMILQQILNRTLLYRAEAVWARDFLARIERALAAEQGPQTEADADA